MLFFEWRSTLILKHRGGIRACYRNQNGVGGENLGQKLFVFCIDALCESDVAYMRTLSNFGWMLREGALVETVDPVYPSFTYPCHVSIITGLYPDRHGIPHNEQCRAGVDDVPWYTDRAMVKGKFLTELAEEKGMSSCMISWPVSGGAHITYNLPMIVPYSYTGDNPRIYLDGMATDNLLDAYYWKYGYLLKGQYRSLDRFTMSVAPDILRDFGQPDLMFVKMCDLDSVRHDLGVDTPEAKEMLRRHNEELGVLLESIRRYGDFENTNFVVLGDHGQTDLKKTMRFNLLLQRAGFQQVDEAGRLISFDAYCHSTGISAWIELRDPADEALRQRVYEFLCSVRDSGEYGIGYVFTKEEAQRLYRLTGPFDFVIEGDPSISFNNELTGELFSDSRPGDYKTAMASHGGLPHFRHKTTLFACGPAVKQGAVLANARLVDEAPTMARMLGLDMADVDGRVLEEILK